ncbi:MAG: protein kinase [Bryobacteraceae bacterium]
MSPSRWSEVRRIFHEALDVQPPARTNYVNQQCGSNEELRAEVHRLLLLHAGSNAALDRPAVPESFLEGMFPRRVFRDGETVGGRYLIERFAGEGGMGEVYAAQDTHLGERVALKTLRPELAGDDAALERFRREVQLARRVTHPNVCRVFDLQQAADANGNPVHFLTMEWLTGETLSEFLVREAPLAADRALSMARQLAAGLDAAHAAGVVHRDFKPGNVIVATTPGEPRLAITDFGLARTPAGSVEVTAGTAAGIGTPAYMAPEQIEGKAAGPAADIYALGIVLYEMVTARRPYEASTPMAMASMKARRTPDGPATINSKLQRHWDWTILRCLSVDPEKRFARAGDVVAALESPVSGFRGGIASALFQRRVVAGTVAAAAMLGLTAWLSTASTPTAEALDWFAKGAEALHDGVPHKASRLLEQAVRTGPEFVEARARLAEAYLDLDLGSRAKDEILRATASLSWRTPRETRDLVEAVGAAVLRDFPASQVALERRAASQQSPREKAAAHLDLGWLYVRASKPAEAVREFEAALAADPNSAAAHLRLGVLAGRRQQLDAATAHFREAERLFRLTGNYEGLGETLLARARALRNARNVTEAAAELSGAEQLARSTSSPVLEVRTVFEQSLLRLREGKLTEAESLAARGRERAQAEGLEALSAQGLNDLGVAALNQYKLDEAERYLRQAADVSERVGSDGNRARAHLNWASTRLRLGDPRGALQHTAIAAEYYRTAGISESLQTALLVEVDARYDSGEHAASAESAAELAAMARKAGDGLHEALALERIAKAARVSGDWKIAVEQYRRAAAIHQAAGRKLQHAYALANEGDVWSAMNRTTEAEALWRKAEQVGGAEGGLPERLQWLRAEAAGFEGRWADAARLARAAMSGNATRSPLRRAMELTLLGDAESRLRSTAPARRHLTEAAALLGPDTLAEVRLALALAQARLEIDSGARPRAGDISAKGFEEAVRLRMPLIGAKAGLLAAACGRLTPEAAIETLREKWDAEALDRFLARRDLEPVRKETIR